MTNIYKKHLYLNKSITFAIASEITEYDISQAGYSLCKQYDLLPKSKMKVLEELSKHDRHVKIGKYQRADKVFSKQLTECFVEARRLFFSHNDLKEENILSIKKDAIFVMNKNCKEQDFGEIHFRPKNAYSSYAYIAECELYYNNMMNVLDIKNINDDKLKKHEDFMISFIIKMFRHLETSTNEVTMRYLKRFIDKYKNLELPAGYYREFDKQSVFNIAEREEDDTLIYDDYWDDRVDELDISYNYHNVIVPFLRQIL